MHLQPMGMYPNKYEWASGNQQSGDCSIWIRAAQLEFDDGSWECQVTASDFHTQDALTSHPVRLVVRGKCYKVVSYFIRRIRGGGFENGIKTTFPKKEAKTFR